MVCFQSLILGKSDRLNFLLWEYEIPGRGLKGKGMAGRRAKKSVELNKKQTPKQTNKAFFFENLTT